MFWNSKLTFELRADSRKMKNAYECIYRFTDKSRRVSGDAIVTGFMCGLRSYQRELITISIEKKKKKMSLHKQPRFG